MLTLNNPLIELSSIPCTLAKSSYSPEVGALTVNSKYTFVPFWVLDNEETAPLPLDPLLILEKLLLLIFPSLSGY